ncbi:MAG: FIST domain protein [Acidobacteria bacterium]|nr:FIST domain protein [Acidobacteriota bacterium]MBV9477975.1 FIST domain protein [Acidobacteriota bacterium]
MRRARLACSSASSAGEFVSGDRGEGSASAVAIRSDVMRFAAGVGRNLRQDRRAAAAEIAGSFPGLTTHQYPYRAALVLADALAGYTDDFIEQLSVATLGNYRFFGGGARDDAQFAKTHVFCGTSVFTDAAVALEILSTKPIGVGVSHGWESASEPLRVTEADGSTVVSLNAAPAAEAFEEHAEKTGQRFDRNDPIPFFLHNVLGIDTGSGFKLRVPLAARERRHLLRLGRSRRGDRAHHEDDRKVRSGGAGSCCSFRPRRHAGHGARGGALFRLRRHAAAHGRRVRHRDGRAPACSRQSALRRMQHVRADRTVGGQFSGFHNCTATVALLPD